MNKKIEIFLASLWKRILIFSGLVVIIFFPIDFIIRNYTYQADIIYYYYDNYFTLFFALIVSSVIIERFRTGNHFLTFGLQITRESLKDIILSFLIVFISFSLLGGLFYLLELNRFTDFSFTDGFIYFIVIIFLYSANEELIFRGIIFQALLDKFGISFTIIISSLVFASVHFDSNSFDYLSFINTFVAGIVLGAMYIQTKSLFLPISFHFFWNFLQQFLLGSNISGNSFGYSIFQMDNGKLPVWLFGGNYGIEGGLIGTILLLLALVLVLKYAKPSPFVSSKLLKREIFENIL